MERQPAGPIRIKLMSYATDGYCHNAEPGTYGHECGKPAEFIGTDRSGFACGYCADCKAHGSEARSCIAWAPVLTIVDANPAHKVYRTQEEAAYYANKQGMTVGMVRGGWQLQSTLEG